MILRILLCLLPIVTKTALGSPPSAKIQSINVNCEEDGMGVDIQFDQAFHGVIFSKNFFSTAGCNYVNNPGSDRVKFTIKAGQCGTVRGRQPDALPATASKRTRRDLTSPTLPAPNSTAERQGRADVFGMDFGKIDKMLGFGGGFGGGGSGGFGHDPYEGSREDQPPPEAMEFTGGASQGSATDKPDQAAVSVGQNLNQQANHVQQPLQSAAGNVVGLYGQNGQPSRVSSLSFNGAPQPPPPPNPVNTGGPYGSFSQSQIPPGAYQGEVPSGPASYAAQTAALNQKVRIAGLPDIDPITGEEVTTTKAPIDDAYEDVTYAPSDAERVRLQPLMRSDTYAAPVAPVQAAPAYAPNNYAGQVPMLQTRQMDAQYGDPYVGKEMGSAMMGSQGAQGQYGGGMNQMPQMPQMQMPQVPQMPGDGAYGGGQPMGGYGGGMQMPQIPQMPSADPYGGGQGMAGMGGGYGGGMQMPQVPQMPSADPYGGAGGMNGGGQGMQMPYGGGMPPMPQEMNQAASYGGEQPQQQNGGTYGSNQQQGHQQQNYGSNQAGYQHSASSVHSSGYSSQNNNNNNAAAPQSYSSSNQLSPASGYNSADVPPPDQHNIDFVKIASAGTSRPSPRRTTPPVGEVTAVEDNGEEDDNDYLPATTVTSRRTTRPTTATPKRRLATTTEADYEDDEQYLPATTPQTPTMSNKGILTVISTNDGADGLDSKKAVGGPLPALRATLQKDTKSSSKVAQSKPAAVNVQSKSVQRSSSSNMGNADYSGNPAGMTEPKEPKDQYDARYESMGEGQSAGIGYKEPAGQYNQEPSFGYKEPKGLGYDQRYDQMGNADLSAGGKEPNMGYHEPAGQFNSEPKFGYNEPAGQFGQEPKFGYNEPSSGMSNLDLSAGGKEPGFGYREPSFGYNEPSFGYREPGQGLAGQDLSAGPPGGGVQGRPTASYQPAVPQAPAYGGVGTVGNAYGNNGGNSGNNGNTGYSSSSSSNAARDTGDSGYASSNLGSGLTNTASSGHKSWSKHSGGSSSNDGYGSSMSAAAKSTGDASGAPLPGGGFISAEGVVRHNGAEQSSRGAAVVSGPKVVVASAKGGEMRLNGVVQAAAGIPQGQVNQQRKAQQQGSSQTSEATDEEEGDEETVSTSQGQGPAGSANAARSSVSQSGKNVAVGGSASAGSRNSGSQQFAASVPGGSTGSSGNAQRQNSGASSGNNGRGSSMSAAAKSTGDSSGAPLPGGGFISAEGVVHRNGAKQSSRGAAVVSGPKVVVASAKGGEQRINGVVQAAAGVLADRRAKANQAQGQVNQQGKAQQQASSQTSEATDEEEGDDDNMSTSQGQGATANANTARSSVSQSGQNVAVGGSASAGSRNSGSQQFAASVPGGSTGSSGNAQRQNGGASSQSSQSSQSSHSSRQSSGNPKQAAASSSFEDDLEDSDDSQRVMSGVATRNGKSSSMQTSNSNQAAISDKDATDGGYIENVIVIQNDPLVQEVWDAARAIRCEWRSNYKKTVSTKERIALTEVQTMRFAGDDIEVWMEIQAGKGPWADPVSNIVPIGHTMTLLIGANDPKHEFDLRVGRCIAHDGTGKTQIDLTDENGCVVRDRIMGKFDKARNWGAESATIAFAHFSAFKFPETTKVFIECDVEVCKRGCSEMCAAGSKSTKLPASSTSRHVGLSSGSQNSQSQLQGQAQSQPGPLGQKFRAKRSVKTDTDSLMVKNHYEAVSQADLSFNIDLRVPNGTIVYAGIRQNRDDYCISRGGFGIAVGIVLMVILISTIVSVFLCIRFRNQRPLLLPHD